jgi:dTMP kinase
MTNNQNGGKYLVLEGLDASGKSTQCERLVKKFQADGRQCEFIAEPGGTDIGQKIRSILKDESLVRSPETNLDLFTICRREIVIQRIGPAALKGTDIISDRNWWSSVAYQGFGEGVDIDTIIEKSKAVMGDYFRPDQMFFIDTSLEEIEERIRLRGGDAQDYFEKKGHRFFSKLRDGYLWLADKYDIEPINGNQSEAMVHHDVLAQLGATSLDDF